MGPCFPLVRSFQTVVHFILSQLSLSLFPQISNTRAFMEKEVHRLKTEYLTVLSDMLTPVWIFIYSASIKILHISLCKTLDNTVLKLELYYNFYNRSQPAVFYLLILPSIVDTGRGRVRGRVSDQLHLSFLMYDICSGALVQGLVACHFQRGLSNGMDDGLWHHSPVQMVSVVPRLNLCSSCWSQRNRSECQVWSEIAVLLTKTCCVQWEFHPLSQLQYVEWQICPATDKSRLYAEVNKSPCCKRVVHSGEEVKSVCNISLSLEGCVNLR